MNVDDILSLYDFLNFFRSMNATFVIDKKTIIENRIERGLNSSIMKNLIENFRNHQRIVRALTTTEKISIIHSAFATLNEKNFDEKNLEGNEKFNKKSSKKKTCICEQLH